MNVVFVFAHQDDEIAFASRLRACAARGDRVTCVCLTDGASQTGAATRDEESRRVLAMLGIDDIRFPGAPRIADGTLPDHLDRALELLEREIADADEVYTLAWEGGHQDHDAVHLVAGVFARRRNIPCIEMPLYNGLGVRGPFFRVNHPVGDGWTKRKLRWREHAANVLLARFYPSQRRTWIGLAPLLLVTGAHELTRNADLRRAQRPPHEGPLLYERRFRYPYARFAERAAAFLRRRSDRD